MSFEEYVRQWELSFEGEKVDICLAKDLSYLLKHLQMESTLLRRCCSVTACLCAGSVCLAHALLWANAGCVVPILRGVPLKWRGASRRALLGDSCCPSGPERGAPSGLVKRHEGIHTLLAFPGSWYGVFLPLSTTGRRPVSLRTELPNPCWKHLPRPPSFCRPLPRVRPVHPLMTFPRAQGCHTDPVLQVSVMPGVRWNSRFQPVLKGPHSSSSWALLSFRYMCGHIAGRDVVPHRTTVLHKYRYTTRSKTV